MTSANQPTQERLAGRANVNQDTAVEAEDIASSLSVRVVKTRHDLHNSLSHILGFSEMLLEELQEQHREHLRPELEFVHRTAGRMMEQIVEKLDTPKIKAGHIDLTSLGRHLSKEATQIEAAIETFLGKSTDLTEIFKSDLMRIAGAAHHTRDLARTSLPALSETVVSETAFFRASSNQLAALLPSPNDSEPAIHALKEGAILVVDDLAENRELLSRRLSRLGYTVKLVEDGQSALEYVAAQPVDLILLDILMPGMDGFEVLRRLKGDPFTHNLPVIMLSSADQVETAVRCIKLGADDFLPKPFNATLLMARIESSLSKKRLRDQEAAFVKRLQAEQEISERLLLNILPKPIAERLKKGEKIIADGFPEVTVLFTDFVAFTKLSSNITPEVLVGNLNEIFSAFDQLCEQYSLEKIKMIGDAYMAVGGLPTPKPDHASAAAALALAMQREVARFNSINHLQFRMRIGLNTGPVVAGVIGTRKFAYDLWGDTVNLASRMEAHAPAGGILVTAETHELLRNEFLFKPGRLIRVKGKGDVLTYLLVGERRSGHPSAQPEIAPSTRTC